MDQHLIAQAADYIRDKIVEPPEIALILGSGLGVLADEIHDAISISYEKIPNFPVSTVTGHAGKLVSGTLEGRRVIAMQGRFHYYEGYSMKQVTFPVRVMKALGVSKLIVTNAAGGVNTSFKPGDLMLITDHINATYDNPLIGRNDNDLGVRFPDMSTAYSPALRALAKKVAHKQGISLQEGVYLGNSGPCYETPAEVRMIRAMGGDAVGMSTVSEVIVARHSGLDVLGVSCITNMAAGILDQPLNHEEVIETTEKVKDTFKQLIRSIVGALPNE